MPYDAHVPRGQPHQPTDVVGVAFVDERREDHVPRPYLELLQAPVEARAIGERPRQLVAVGQHSGGHWLRPPSLCCGRDRPDSQAGDRAKRGGDLIEVVGRLTSCCTDDRAHRDRLAAQTRDPAYRNWRASTSVPAALWRRSPRSRRSKTSVHQRLRASFARADDARGRPPERRPEWGQGALDGAFTHTHRESGGHGSSQHLLPRRPLAVYKRRHSDLADEEGERFRLLFGPEFVEEYRQFARESPVVEETGSLPR
jgi:hypothetical protein